MVMTLFGVDCLADNRVFRALSDAEVSASDRDLQAELSAARQRAGSANASV